MIGLFEGIEVGSWYRVGGSAYFEVVALDMASETIEIQYYDGAVEELDFDSWLELGALPCSAPNDASGALDLGDDAGFETEFDTLYPGSRVNPLDQLDWH